MGLETEEIDSKTIELLSKEINEELFINLYKTTNLKATKVENTNQLVKLFKEEVKSYKLSNQIGKIVFNEFIYITTIGFKPEKEGKFELSYKNIANITKKITKTEINDKGRIVFPINDTVTEFSISYERKNILVTKSLKIIDLWVWGLDLVTLNKEINYIKKVYDDREDFLDQFNTLKDEISNAKDELINQKQKTDEYITSKNDEISEIEKEIETLETTKSDLRATIQDLENNREKLDSQISAKNLELERQIKNSEDLKKQNEALDKDIYELKTRKEKLAEEVNLVPDNLIGFNQRTNESKKTYYWLCTIPLLILCILFYCAWHNITKLSTVENIETLEEAYVLVIQRLPLTILIITMVSILIALLYKMLRHLMEIQQQELSLSKISVLARDIADTEYQYLPENEKQEHRIKYKMQLIREYFNSEFKRYQEFMKAEQIEDKESYLNIPTQLKELLQRKNR